MLIVERKTFLFCAIFLGCLFSTNVHGQAGVQSISLSKDSELIKLWEKDHKIETLASLIPLYLWGSAKQGIAQSREKAFFWCRIALNSDFIKQDGITYFKERGIYKELKRLADNNNPEACYIMSGLLYAQSRIYKAKLSTDIIKYLETARLVNPLAYPLLLDLVGPERMLLLGEEMYQQFNEFDPKLQKVLIQKMKECCDRVWSAKKFLTTKLLEQIFLWYIKAEARLESIMSIVSEIHNRKLFQEFACVDKTVLTALKRVCQGDAQATYTLGSLFLDASKALPEKVQQNKDQAIALFKEADKKGNLQASWILEAHKQKKISHDSLKSLLERTKKAATESKLTKDLQTLIGSALECYSAQNLPAEELYLLGDYYATGIKDLVEPDLQSACTYYRAAYEKEFDEQNVLPIKRVSTKIREKKLSKVIFIKTALEKLSGAQESPRKSILLSMLDDYPVTKMSLDDAIALSDLYLHGIPNILEPSTADLIRILRLVSDKFGPADLKIFMKKTQVAQSHTIHKHQRAHHLITYLMINIEQKINPIKMMSEEGQTRVADLVRVHAPLEQTVQLLSEIIKRIEHDEKVLAKEGPNIVSLCHCLTGLLERCMVDRDPFFPQGIQQADKFKQLLKGFIDRRAKNGEHLHLDITLTRTYVLICLLINSGFMSPSFQEGLKYLGHISSDVETKRLASLFCINAQLYIHPENDSLAVMFSIALVSAFTKDYLTAQRMLRQLVAWGRKTKSVKYVEFSKTYNPLLYVNQFITSPEVNKAAKIWLCVYFFAHYQLLAVLGENDAKQHSLAQAFWAKGEAIQPAFMQIALGTEYMVGTLFDVDFKKGGEHILDAVKKVDLKTCSSEDFSIVLLMLKNIVQMLEGGDTSANEKYSTLFRSMIADLQGMWEVANQEKREQVP